VRTQRRTDQITAEQQQGSRTVTGPSAGRIGGHLQLDSRHGSQPQHIVQQLRITGDQQGEMTTGSGWRQWGTTHACTLAVRQAAHERRTGRPVDNARLVHKRCRSPWI
jgi:hypothetical protein